MHRYVTADALAKQMGWDLKDDSMKTIQEEHSDEEESMSQYGDSQFGDYDGGGGSGANPYASRASAYGFGALGGALHVESS